MENPETNSVNIIADTTVWIEVETVQGAFVQTGFRFEGSQFFKPLFREIEYAMKMDNIVSITAFKEKTHDGKKIRWYFHRIKRSNHAADWHHDPYLGATYSRREP